MLISSPAPPKPSMTKDNAAPSMTGVSHGSALSHPSPLVPPRRRPAISTDAHIVNTVSNVGKATSAVNTEFMARHQTLAWSLETRIEAGDVARHQHQVD